MMLYLSSVPFIVHESVFICNIILRYKNKLTQEINHTDSQIWLSDLNTFFIFNMNWISDTCGKIEPLQLKAIHPSGR